MENPTTGNESQFQRPFNILPDRLYRTTIGRGITSGQFTTPLQLGNYNTYDILPNVSYTNPTREEPSQFIKPFTVKTTSPIPHNFISSNIDRGTIENKGIQLAGNILGGTLGLSSISSIGSSLLNSGHYSTTYNTLPFDSLTSQPPRGAFNADESFKLGSVVPGVKYQDFRSRYRISTESGPGKEIIDSISSLNANGASATLRGSFRAGKYALTSLSPAGAYSIFNIKQTYGFGDHDDPGALRKDFTARSMVTTKWKKSNLRRIDNGKEDNGNKWVPTINPLERATPFRGDKVNVIDYKKSTLKSAYRWMPKRSKILGKITDFLGTGVTQDFIKFYFTGPTIQPGGDQEDDIMAFRAIITSFDDSFSADWSGVNMVGRADPNYHYGGFSRAGSLAFDIYATDRDELKPIYRKLNALASYTAPIYDSNSIAMIGPWMRITIGDIHNQQPIVMTSVTYTYGMDTPWEINIENDPENMQTPMRVSVTCQFNIIGNDIPQNNGRLLSLAKKYTDDGKSIQGNDNWLSDSKSTVPNPNLFDKTVGGKKAERKTARGLRADDDTLSRKDSFTEAKKQLAIPGQ